MRKTSVILVKLPRRAAVVVLSLPCVVRHKLKMSSGLEWLASFACLSTSVLAAVCNHFCVMLFGSICALILITSKYYGPAEEIRARIAFQRS